MGIIIDITSGKGGTGKSTLTANVGVALALLGSRVLVADADAGLRAQDMLLGVAGDVVYDIGDVLAGRCETLKAIAATRWQGLSLFPAPAEDDEAAAALFPRLCRGLAQYYDFVLLDSPAGMGAWARAAAAAADMALVVATADPVCVRDADRTAALLLGQGCRNIRLVINRVQPRILKKRLPGGLDAVIDAAAVQLIGVVPEDGRVTLAAFDAAPVVRTGEERGGAPAAFGHIARRLRGEDVPLSPY